MNRWILLCFKVVGDSTWYYTVKPTKDIRPGDYYVNKLFESDLVFGWENLVDAKNLSGKHDHFATKFIVRCSFVEEFEMQD